MDYDFDSVTGHPATNHGHGHGHSNQKLEGNFKREKTEEGSEENGGRNALRTFRGRFSGNAEGRLERVACMHTTLYSDACKMDGICSKILHHILLVSCALAHLPGGNEMINVHDPKGGDNLNMFFMLVI